MQMAYKTRNNVFTAQSKPALRYSFGYSTDSFIVTYCVLEALLIFPTMKGLPQMNEVEHFGLIPMPSS